MPLEPEERELWRRHLHEQDPQARDFLFMRYAPWSRLVARDVYRRIRVSQLEWSDFVQNATIGLLEAMSRFDPDRGLDFTAYAKPRVRGSVFNGLRVFLTGVDRAPREDRHHQRLESLAADQAGDGLTNFIETVVGLGIGFLVDAEASNDGIAGASEGHASAEAHQVGQLLREAIDTLPDRQRMIVTAHYFQYVPFCEIAAELGLTKGRVSQIHKVAMAHIRSELSRRRLGRYELL